MIATGGRTAIGETPVHGISDYVSRVVTDLTGGSRFQGQNIGWDLPQSGLEFLEGVAMTGDRHQATVSVCRCGVFSTTSGGLGSSCPLTRGRALSD
jgi:hypothetical protein